ncbi:lipopolysaccharide biosynthesis protein [Fulvimarina sp. 2208YS6-2-32]|uniref:Lipopolysaccharide biosynthesis protein n=1 Tax=Fulvimarina uroteuthidis TaxID=3098149 RepID=A0ABU5I199_9HYPH|nr:lipopolysaccharide biosynthesis protein [Fulvimarina sp. 2208YS6-2-32]MDY8107946.1 lipopolysaccharide biosynthesis protein [Fulvimarina sp. 2208YS6-2-32]
MSRIAVLRQTLKGDLSAVRDYASLVSGSLGRMILSLGYFVCVANGLTIGDFGLFATASATGVMLSRLCGFGFYSPLYRTATVRPRLIGTYTAGYVAASLASLPLVALVAAAFYLAVFAGEMGALAFALVLGAEIIGWRSLEIVIIVNNGLGRFGRGAILTIAGTAIKALAAIGFWLLSDGSLLTWAALYLGANIVSAIGAAVLCYPRQRLRFRPKLYLARWRDSVSVSGADVVFYLQSDLDKLLVLAFGGPAVAGIYAIIMRLVDLTALPVRSFNTLIVQKIMKTPAFIGSWKKRIGIEALIAAVSTGGMLALGGFLWVFPAALGANVADAAPLILLALFVPAFRNLVEYENELLYATGKTGIRVSLLAGLGVAKAGLLAVLLTHFEATRDWVLALNGCFAILWLGAAFVAYTALDWERRRAARAGPFSLSGLQPGE